MIFSTLNAAAENLRLEVAEKEVIIDTLNRDKDDAQKTLEMQAQDLQDLIKKFVLASDFLQLLKLLWFDKYSLNSMLISQMVTRCTIWLPND